MDELMPVLMTGTQRRSFPGNLPDQLALRTLSALAGHPLTVAEPPPRDDQSDPRPLAPTGTLAEILSGQRLDCLEEWLQLCGPRRIPPALLPQALEWGRGPLLLEAAGPRGLWLAAQNPEWKHHLPAATSSDLWDTGTLRQRAAWLAEQSPERQAELLTAAWKGENAAARAQLLVGVKSLPALELGLADRSKTVRTAAAQGLWQFPDHPQVQQWLAQLQTGKPPATAPGFDFDFPGLGEKAAWLAQLAALSPLGPFVAPRGEWREALMDGYTRAAMRQERPDWAGGLLLAGQDFNSLFSLAPPAARETVLLDGPPHWERYASHRPFSPALAAKIWHELQTVTRGPYDSWPGKAIPALGHGFSVKLSLQEGWPEASPHWRYWNSAVEKMLTLHSFRRRMHEEMA